MDIRISGRGDIPSGEYEKISVSGKGVLHGSVRAISFKSSGTVRGENLDAETIKASGRARFEGNITAKSIRASGSLSCNNIECEDLTTFGSLKVNDNIEANNLKLEGYLKCKGHIKAENIKIVADRMVSVGSVEGKNITIKRKRLSLLKRGAVVSSSVEGESLSLSYVTCPYVDGKSVEIGRGCKIGLVKYSEEIKVSKGAVVGKIEKR